MSAPRRLLVLGLDQSGKSSVLSALARDEPVESPEPTEGFNVVSIQTGDTPLNVWEVGGNGRVREFWPQFVDGTDALVFVVDSANPNRLPEARAEMHKLLANEKLARVPVVVIANKQDLPSAESPATILAALGLMAEDVPSREVHILGNEVTPGNTCIGADDIRRLLESLWQAQ